MMISSKSEPDMSAVDSYHPVKKAWQAITDIV